MHSPKIGTFLMSMLLFLFGALLAFNVLKISFNVKYLDEVLMCGGDALLALGCIFKKL